MSLIPLSFWKNKGEGNIITSNLIFYYDPAKTTSYPGSGTTVTDLSVNGYNSTLQNGVGFSSTDGGGSFTFDGVNDNIFPGYPNTTNIGAKFLNQSFTLEAWVKPSTVSPPSRQSFFAIRQDGTTRRNLHCRFYSDGVVRMGYFGDDLDTSQGVGIYGAWQHIAMRYNSSTDTSTIFKNGIQVAQGNSGPLESSGTGTDCFIGDGIAVPDAWKGSIGAIYAYQATLTDSEINSNFNALKSRYGYRNDIVSSGNVLYLDANKTLSYPGSGSTWSDLSTQNNNTTLYNTVGYTSSLGGQLTFNGTNQYGDASNSSSLNPSSQITISMVLSSNSLSSFRSPLMKTTSMNWDDGYGFYQNNGIFYFFVNLYNGSHVVSINKGGSFTLRNFVGVYDGSKLTLYENGNLVATGTSYTQSITNSTTALNIARGGGNQYWWGGNISQVLIYNRALTPEEIQSNYYNIKQIYTI